MRGANFLNQTLFQTVVPHIEAICRQNHVDDTHGLAHALKIASLTEKALQFEELDTQSYEDLVLAALLHDIDDHKYFKTTGYSNAKDVLNESGLDPFRVNKIVSMIALVSFSKNGNTISSEVPISYYLPRYIDRTEAIGLQGLYRALLYSIEKQSGVPVYREDTPRPASKEEMMEISQGRDAEYMQRGGQSISVVDHIFDKLVHIKLPSEITNRFLVELYQQKQTQMVQFVLKHAKNCYNDYQSEIMEEYRLNGKQWESFE